MFARFGLPKVMVTDNGTCFTSSELVEFAECNKIRHVGICPYHPSSNGLAERAVQTLKSRMKKQLSGTIQTKLSRFLFHYRLTPHTTTGVAPAELLFLIVETKTTIKLGLRNSKHQGQDATATGKADHVI